jgi:hypothetical protein
MALDINDIQQNDTPHTSIECRYAEYRNYSNVMLGVVILNVVMLIVVAQQTLHLKHYVKPLQNGLAYCALEPLL